MNESQRIGALEAMLFANAEPVETARLADALRLSAEDCEMLLTRLQTRYDETESGLALLRFEEGRWQMTTRPYYGEMVKRILDTRRNARGHPAPGHSREFPRHAQGTAEPWPERGRAGSGRQPCGYASGV